MVLSVRCREDWGREARLDICSAVRGERSAVLVSWLALL